MGLMHRLIVPWLWASSASAVYLGWPMSEQLPNVARVDESYLFTLANSTYKSSAGGTITYLASNLPLWLLFDSSSRTFYGTPSSDDVLSFDISLSGVDSADGSNYTGLYSMIVSNSSGIELSSADVMFTQIAQYGNTNGVDGLVLSQGDTFLLQFSEDVFKLNTNATLPIIAYYGRSGDRTSLPSWISFDLSSLTFSGTVPYVTSDIAPTQQYSFSFIASDYTGYAGAEGTFQILVGAHVLSTSLNETIKINGTYGSTFSYTAPIFTDVYLDDELVTLLNISSVVAQDLPSYISFDTLSYVLEGTFPNSTSALNFTILVYDYYGNLVSLPYEFDSTNSIFTVDSLPDVNATRGEFFSYELLQSMFTDYNETTIDVTSGASWLAYHSNLTLNGDVPSDFNETEVTLDASSSYGTGLLSFNIKGIDKVANITSLSSSSASSSTSLSLGTLSATAVSTTSSLASALNEAGVSKTLDSGMSAHTKLVIGLAVGLPCFAILVIVAALCFFCCGRKRNRDAESLSQEEITGPGFGTINTLNDEGESAQQLGALNALKLEHDNASSTSTLTHVNSENEFYDAPDKPMLSWRANESTDLNALKTLANQRKRTSELSVSTVNTEQLFSVRLVDDRNISRESEMLLPAVGFAGLQRSESANIQKLDSDGNIAGADYSATSSPKKRDLNHISEEESPSSQYTHDLSLYNLLSKFLGLQGGSDHSNLTSRAHAPQDEFVATRDNSGSLHWRSSESLLISPDSETFLLKEKGLNNPRARTSLSELSGDDRPGHKAKLVDFTRKASLRDSAREQTTDHAANAALIYDGSDKLLSSL